MICTVTAIDPAGMKGFGPLSGRFLWIADTSKLCESVQDYEGKPATRNEAGNDLKHTLTCQGRVDRHYFPEPRQ